MAGENEQGRRPAKKDCNGAEHSETCRGTQPDGDEEPEDRACAARGTGCYPDADDGRVPLLGAHDATPNTDSTIAWAASGARVSRATPRMSTVIANRKNWQHSCSAATNRTSSVVGTDAANRFLDHGNYLAYGLAASACWVLGLPHGLAVLHGKTRRGGLVFDVADLIKDATILPQAFCSAMQGHSEQQFRQACIEALTRSEALDFMIGCIKTIALQLSTLAQQQSSVPKPASEKQA